MTLVLVTASGEQHGLINSVSNSVRDDDFKHMSPENKAKAIKAKKEDSRKVKARYINHRGNHERLTKPYMRYAGDPIQTYHLIPGHIYELPMGFINEVNNSGIIRRSQNDTDNTPVGKIEGKDQIHELVPVSF